MSLNYPDEADFTDLPVQTDAIETIDDVHELFRELEPIAESRSVNPVSIILDEMGMHSYDELNILWGDRQYTVIDDGTLYDHITLRDHSHSSNSQYAEYEVKDEAQFILDWFTGDLVPAVQTGDWVPRRDHTKKTYVLTGENKQDPYTQYTIIGDPVTVDTHDKTDTDIFEYVYNHVSENSGTHPLPNADDPELFLIEITEFKSIQP